MKSGHPRKTLHMIVKNEWLADSIISLGSGFITYLVYQNQEIEPQVVNDIRAHDFGEDVPGEIVHWSGQSGRRIAKVEILTVNDFKTFIRFDFRILEVRPFLRNGWALGQMDYFCFYGKRPG